MKIVSRILETKIIGILIIAIYALFLVLYIYKSFYKGEFIRIGIIKLSIIFIISFVFIYISHRKKKIFFAILLLLIIFSFLYSFTYQWQYDLPEFGYRIDSHIYLEETENLNIHSYEQNLEYYGENYARLTEILHIINNQDHDIESLIYFYPPNKTYNTILKLGKGNISNDHRIINGSIRDMVKFEPVTGKNIKVIYEIKDVKPYGLVSFWIDGKDDSKPLIEKLEATVSFNILKFECSEPCFILKNQSSYYRSYIKMKGPENGKELKKIYNIYHENNNELDYFLQTTNRLPILIRNILLAIIIGLFVNLIGIVFKAD